MESARADSDARYTAYVLVLVLGLRRGEVLGLRWQAVDFEAGELIIDHQLQRVRRELLYRETKTDASDASLPLPKMVATALQLRREQQDKARIEAGEAWQHVEGGPDLVFHFRRVAPLSFHDGRAVWTPLITGTHHGWHAATRRPGAGWLKGDRQDS